MAPRHFGGRWRTSRPATLVRLRSHPSGSSGDSASPEGGERRRCHPRAPAGVPLIELRSPAVPVSVPGRPSATRNELRIGVFTHPLMKDGLECVFGPSNARRLPLGSSGGSLPREVVSDRSQEAQRGSHSVGSSFAIVTEPGGHLHSLAHAMPGHHPIEVTPASGLPRDPSRP